jgi:hypothetical protein
MKGLTMSYHVREVLERVQGPAPARRTSTDDIIATARRMRARRSAVTIAGSAAAVCLAIAVAAAVGLGRPAADLSAASATSLVSADTFSTMLGEYRVGPYQIGPVGAVTAGYQSLPVYRDGHTWKDYDGKSYPLVTGTITIYRPGFYNPDSLGAGGSAYPAPSGSAAYPAPSGSAGTGARGAFGRRVPVTVGGRQGIARELVYSTDEAVGAQFSPPNQQGKYVRTALAWQYEPGVWATYIPDLLRQSESTEDAVRIAAAVTPQADRKIRMPYQLTFMPNGWQTVAATETPAKISSVVSEVVLHNGPIPKSDLANKIDLRLPGVHIVAIKGQPKDEALRGKQGTHCHSPQLACTLIVGDHFIEVDGRNGGMSEPDFRRFVDGLKPVNIADLGAWVSAG